MILTCKKLLQERQNVFINFYLWLPLITWTVFFVIPLLICVTLDVLMVLDMKFPWDSSRENCHPILSGLFFYSGLILMYYNLRHKKPMEPCLRWSMISAGLLFMSLYLIDIICLSLWFVTLDSGMTLGLMILPIIYIPLSCFYLRYFYRDLSLRIPEKIDAPWNCQEFLHV